MWPLVSIVQSINDKSEDAIEESRQSEADTDLAFYGHWRVNARM